MRKFDIETASPMIRDLLGSEAVEWEPVNTSAPVRDLPDSAIIAYGYTADGERITARAGSAKCYLANVGR